MCVSVTFVHSVKTNKHIFKKFSPSGSHTILVFPYQTAWQYSDGPPPLTGTSNAGGGTHLVSLHVVNAATGRCCQYDAVGPPCRKLYHFAGSKRRCLLMAGKDGEMFITRSFNVTPKTTEQHLIARRDKSIAYVTNNKRLCSTFCAIEANY